MQDTRVVVLPPLAPRAVAARRVLPVAFLALVTAASAQAAGLDMTPGVTAFSNAMLATINNNIAALFGLLAVAAGFYFIWGRIRSMF